MRKNKAATIYFDERVQKRIEDQEGTKIEEFQKVKHFEVGQQRGESEEKIIKISECFFGGIKIKFSDGICWKYKGFKYIIS